MLCQIQCFKNLIRLPDFAKNILIWYIKSFGEILPQRIFHNHKYFNTVATQNSINIEQTTSVRIPQYRLKKGEKYMNSNQRKHFHKLLEAWRQELCDETSKTVHTLQDETINHPDPTDRASQETDMSIELRNRDRGRRLLRKIDDSLSRLETGDYGYCEGCGVEIGIRRLEARPTATLCVDCKTLAEHQERKNV